MNRYGTWFRSAGLLAGLVTAGAVQAGVVFGTGATFPNQVYQEWGRQYKAETGTAFVYAPVGSGKGIAAITSGKTDFGASDKPLKPADLEKHKLMQFPALIGGVVPVVNLKHVGDGQLKLDGPVLANIYLGKITRWNDAAITALNPGLALPNEAINVVYRSDKSGSTFNFTNYLSKVSAEWKTSMGSDTSVAWKTGAGADGGDNLAKKISDTPHSIGYIDPALVQKKHLTFVQLRNREGAFVSPNAKSFAAAAAGATWSADNGFGQILTDQPGKESWPLATATFILLARAPSDVSGTNEALKYFDWAFRKGGATASNLGFVSIPAEVIQKVRGAWKVQIKDHAGQPVWNQ